MTTAFVARALGAPGGVGVGSVGERVAILLATLVAVLVATRLLGVLARRVGQPAVLGELLAGVLLGGSGLHLLDPTAPVISILAEIGVVLLLFETGLHTDRRQLVAVGWVAAIVAVTGVAAPLGLGLIAMHAFGFASAPALICAAALCATSVGISARVLAELGWLDSVEGRVVMGAAVIDDVIGLIILAIVAALVAGQGISAGGLAGSGVIVAAFAAGLMLDDSPSRRKIDRVTGTLGTLFVPIFFASVAARLDLRALAQGRVLAVGSVLIAAGVVGKLLAGYAPFWFRGRKLLVGIAMIPRGEVGLIFAQLGVVSGALDAGLFGAIMLMVFATTFVTPPALAAVTKGRPPADASAAAGTGAVGKLL